MIIKNTGGKDFQPDPLLETEDVDYQARIIGVAYIGKHQNKKFDSEEIEEIPQAIVEYEIVEDGTQVERGPEDAKRLENRRLAQFIKYSSHEKSGMFKLAQTVNPKAAYLEKKQGQVDTSLIIGRPVLLTLKLNKDGDRTNIKEVLKMSPRYQKDVAEGTYPIFQYSVDDGAFPVEGKETRLEDVPEWILKHALNKAVDCEQFGQIDEIEEYLESLNQEGEDELEGDRLPTEDKEDKKEKKDPREEKEPAKKDPEPEEEGAEDTPDPEEEEKSSKRTRRSRKKETVQEDDEYSGMGIEELEDAAIEKGILTDDDLDDMNEEFDTDEKYKEAVLKKLRA